MPSQGGAVLVQRRGGGQVGVAGTNDGVVVSLDNESRDEHHTLHSVLVVCLEPV